jgi:hypothetical protein
MVFNTISVFKTRYNFLKIQTMLTLSKLVKKLITTTILCIYNMKIHFIVYLMIMISYYRC